MIVSTQLFCNLLLYLRFYKYYGACDFNNKILENTFEIYMYSIEYGSNATKKAALEV